MPQNFNEYQIGQSIAKEGKLVKKTISKILLSAPAYLEIQKLSDITFTNAEPEIKTSELCRD